MTVADIWNGLKAVAGKLGLWRIGAAVCLVHARKDDKLAADLAAAGLANAAGQMRELAASRRRRAALMRP
jgi:hypothetical protein